MVNVYAARGQVRPTSCEFYENATEPVVAYITGPDGNYLADASGSGKDLVTAATVKVFDLHGATPGTAIYSATLTVATVFTTTLTTTGDYWTLGGVGYNFIDLVTISPASFGAADGHTYRIEYTFTTTTNGKQLLEVIATCKGMVST